MTKARGQPAVLCCAVLCCAVLCCAVLCFKSIILFRMAVKSISKNSGKNTTRSNPTIVLPAYNKIVNRSAK